MRNCVRLLTNILVAFLLATLLVPAGIEAASKTVKEYAQEVEDNNTKKLTLNRDTVITSISRDMDNPTDMVKDVTYTITYPDALDYFGKDLTVMVEVTLKSTDADPETGQVQVYIDQLGLVHTNWRDAYNTNTEWKITIMDGDSLYPVPLLVGIKDPDESNYLYSNANSREMYYVDADISEGSVAGKPTASQAYIVENDGLYHIDDKGNKYNPSKDSAVSFYDGALFLISMNNEAEFTFNTRTYRNGGIWTPEFYSLKGKWNVTYILNDSKDVPADNNKNKDFKEYESGVNFERQIEEPSREGYIFKGWKRHDLTNTESEDNHWIKKYDFGDKTFEAQWEAAPREYTVEYYYMDEEGQYPVTPDSTDTRTSKNYEKVSVTDEDKTPTKKNYVLDGDAEHVYEEVIMPNGDTVLKVYFKRTYTVTYKPGSQGVFDEQKTPDLDYGVDTPEFDGTPKGNPGYSFVGWDETPADKVTKDAIYVAVWEPWKYYIEYDANGGKGIMDKQTFTYSDDTMTSKPNEFTRSGYRFTGFKYEHNGDVKIVRNIDEFRDLLVDDGPGSSITLVAQWERIPEGYTAPVTGVE